MALLLDELERTQAQAAVLVRLAEEPDGLALGAETADRLLVGNVEGEPGDLGRGRCAFWEIGFWGWRGGRVLVAGVGLGGRQGRGATCFGILSSSDVSISF